MLCALNSHLRRPAGRSFTTLVTSGYNSVQFPRKKRFPSEATHLVTASIKFSVPATVSENSDNSEPLPRVAALTMGNRESIHASIALGTLTVFVLISNSFFRAPRPPLRKAGQLPRARYRLNRNKPAASPHAAPAAALRCRAAGLGQPRESQHPGRPALVA